MQNGHCGTNPGEKMTQADWATKENQIQDDFVWGFGPEALYQMTRAEYKTEPDKIAIEELIRLFNEYFLPKRNTYHNRGDFFWTEQAEHHSAQASFSLLFVESGTRKLRKVVESWTKFLFDVKRFLDSTTVPVLDSTPILLL